MGQNWGKIAAKGGKMWQLLGKMVTKWDERAAKWGKMGSKQGQNVANVG